MGCQHAIKVFGQASEAPPSKISRSTTRQRGLLFALMKLFP
jgi:hypothetical protein